ncbi:CvpA family protein [Paenibacillus xerothermodurans]|uniref:CvpA family protein n=1 Tax=Paenibacillus xerothermodurans TaxID=1977292 RepID=A0A2W1NLR5_PAEXE|nr:CvpA family protein [Paenibacillus xerothermodurans]PZE20395.1 CvpA family protein [Paenibacillus xerothermodurans]
MNGLDWTAAVVIAAGTLLGFYRGLVSQLVSVAGLVLAYIAAFAFYQAVAPWVAKTLALPASETYQKYEFLVQRLRLDTYIYNAIAFALLLFGVKIALSFAGRILNLIALAPGVKLVNKWSGAMLGLAESLLLIIIAVQVMAAVPNDAVQQVLAGSRSAPYMLDAVPSLTDKLQQLWARKAP